MTKYLASTAKTSLLACSLITLASNVALSTANANVKDQFSSCAAEAMAAKSLSAKKVSLNLPSTSTDKLDHDLSVSQREYLMKLVNPSTGESLGKVRCTLFNDGTIKSVRYVRENSKYGS